MQNNLKITLENLDVELRKLSKIAFDIDDESRIILGLIAKHGMSTETRITSLGKRRILLSREKIRRRLLITDLSNGFVSTKKGERIGNLQGKQERIYSLTFKGILASLSETKLSENYWIHNYLSNIESITNKKISELFLKNIYCATILFLLLNMRTKGSLTNYGDSQKDINDCYHYDGYLHYLVFSNNDIQGIPSNLHSLFQSCAVEFYVSCNVIANLIHDVKLPKEFQAGTKRDQNNTFQIIFFDHWMYSIFDAEENTFEKTFKMYPDPDIDLGKSFNFQDVLGDLPEMEIEKMSKNLYLKLNSRGKFDYHNTMIFPRPSRREKRIEPETEEKILFPNKTRKIR